MTDTELKNEQTIEIFAEEYSNYLIPSALTDNNKTLIKDILSFVMEKHPVIFLDFYNYLIAEENHLNDLASNVGLSRYFDGYELTNQDLRLLMSFKILKDRLKIKSLFELKEILFNFFENKINVETGYNSIIYYIDKSFFDSYLAQAIIKYKLLPIPIDAYEIEVYKFDSTKKYVHFPIQYDEPIYNLNQSPLSSNYDDENILWLDLNDKIQY
jgi:hypothetical protein